MTTKEEPQQELQEDIEVVSPGQMLQEARVAADLSQEQVAQRLKLRIQVIQDIEADSYDSGLSSTFIKGYLKTYARLVNVSEGDVISSYAHLHDAQEQRTEMQSFSRRISQETHDSRLMQFTYLLGLALVVALVVWWWQQNAQQKELLEQRSTNETLQLAPLEPQAEPAVEALINSASPDELPLVEPESPLASSQPGAETVSESSQAAKAAESLPVSPEANSEQPQALAEPVTAPGQESEQVEVVAAAETLVLNFAQECWIEVRDASGKRLTVGTKAAGSELNLQGQAPFNVTLGHANGVTISYQGQNVDLSAYSNGRVAKFSVPAN